ncbi:MAG: universal stress protein [Chlorobium sp.]|uniref:universal stress protein n=1 Tax=Chlorobium sp. TaxID=1095 RepID=UPI002F41A2D9
MHNARNILYVSNDSGDPSEGMKQALALAALNCAELTVLLVYPELPKGSRYLVPRFEEFLAARLRDSVDSISTGRNPDEAPISIVVEGGSRPPAIRVIQRVLQAGHDLVIKDAEPKAEGRGFRATDMTMLRKCPCTLWLVRPPLRAYDEMHIAVAVDSEFRDEAERDLSLRLLRLADALGQRLKVEPTVLSCWDFEFEEYLHKSQWLGSVDEHPANTVTAVEHHHRIALDALIAESGMLGMYHVRHLRGRADAVIPLFADRDRVDILIMGTVARTGISGFIIGNTAENILEEISCSLVALKPEGFVSPINAQ